MKKLLVVFMSVLVLGFLATAAEFEDLAEWMGPNVFVAVQEGLENGFVYPSESPETTLCTVVSAAFVATMYEDYPDAQELYPAEYVLAFATTSYTPYVRHVLSQLERDGYAIVDYTVQGQVGGILLYNKVTKTFFFAVDVTPKSVCMMFMKYYK